MDSLDDTTPLPELSFDDLLEPPTTSKHSDAEEFISAPANDSLNTPRPKKAAIQILENKRLQSSLSSISGASIKVVPGGMTNIIRTPPLKTQVTDVKVLNKIPARPLKELANPPTVKTTGTTITVSTATTPTTATKNLSGVVMTQIKTTDGRVLYLQKAASATTPKVTASPTITTTKAVVNVSPTTGNANLQSRFVSAPAKSLVMPPGIQKAVLAKGVTIAGTGLVKAAVPSSTTITIKGITPINTAKTSHSTAISPSSTVVVKKPNEGANSPSLIGTPKKVPFQIVRTADGKLIKLNQSSSLVLNSPKSATPSTNIIATTTSAGVTPKASSSTVAAAQAAIKLSPSAVVVTKKLLSPATSAQLVSKSPQKSVTSISSTSVASSSSTTTSPSTTTSLTAGKMIVQSSTGKQIVVSSKNIIKLSPKAAPTATVSKPTVGSAVMPTTGAGSVHAIQLQGKSGVQYVRVLPNTSKVATSTAVSTKTSEPGTTVTVTTKPNTPTNSTSKQLGALSQKLTIVRQNTAASSSASGTTKYIMRGGSIVPVTQTQSLVKRTVISPTSSPSTSANTRPLVKSLGSNMEVSLKQKLSDLNMKIQELASDDASDTSDPEPEVKRPRYVVMMPKSKQQEQQHLHKVLPARQTMQRVSVQGTASSSSSKNATGPMVHNLGKKVYNIIKASGTNGVKYMICNSATRPTSGGSIQTLRRPYTLSESKQQLRYKHLKAVTERRMLAQQKLQRLASPQQSVIPQKQAQIKQQQQKQQLQQQQQKQQLQQQQQLQLQQQQLEQEQQQAQASQQTISGSKPVPAKPLFDILKPAPSAAAAVPKAGADALAGLASRRKHCNCSKSQCLKLYCDCFANGEFCQDCTCKDCFNNLEFEDERQRAIRSCLERNPSAFKPKITARDQGDMRAHNKGCNCKRSGCLKNYCECYEAKIPCSSICKCVGCRNMEDRPDVDMDTMDNLSALPRAMGSLPHSRTNVYLTDDVIEATIMCMISRIVMHEKQNLPIDSTEREVMEELGESLNQIIKFARDKNETAQLDDSKVA